MATDDDLCDFTDLPKATCDHCKPAAPKVEQPQVSGPPKFRRSGSILAEFPGRCRGCGGDIEPGDYIKRDTRDDWVHEECA